MTILEWVDSANLSRTKRNLSRDFSDGVLLAELLKNHVPSLVDIHNYISSSNSKQKLANWLLLNKKVLNKIGYDLSDEEIDMLINSKNNYIETLLKALYVLVSVLFNFKLKKYSENPNNKLVNLTREKSPNKSTKFGGSKEKKLAPSEEKYMEIIKDKDKQIEYLMNRIKALEGEIKHFKEK